VTVNSDSAARNYFTTDDYWMGYFGKELDRTTLIQMLKREDELRKSDQTMALYSESDEWRHLINVTIGIQKQVLQEFGYSDDALTEFHIQRAQYQKDPEICNLAVYIKYDKSSKGTLKEGSSIPKNIQLFDLQGQQTTLSNFLSDKPLVILAGSYT